ncbi:UPF0175 family protein [Caldisalinibacter kiritimatiensis]|uniref:Uncharacterized protein n=1 Tax=Caldisalinibacter kiritimatiensis TaxID=1304284 RepID=R1AXI3_9FIRM|nr:UPF0175 family protein [Caldisalinibacter kiritimatiensis]EOD01903.1 hypothetical protein L21TH_0009 [Caldisalinibacter kiritimatiensis]
MAIDEEYLRVNLKNDFKEVFKADSEKYLHENIKISLAIAAFIEKRVTLARAAELADKNLSEFIKILTRYQIPWMEYTEDTFLQDEKTLEELRGIEND